MEAIPFHMVVLEPHLLFLGHQPIMEEAVVEEGKTMGMFLLEEMAEVDMEHGMVEADKMEQLIQEEGAVEEERDLEHLEELVDLE